MSGGFREPGGSEREARCKAVLRIARRSPRRSSLFWWLFDHHDELLAEQGGSSIGLSWEALCPELIALGLTLTGGAPISPARARLTWWRVRKEKARLRALEEEEEAEREARRARDPRRNMPSRFPKGDYGPPLSDRQPPRAAPQRALAVWSGPGALVPSGEWESGLVMPGGPVRTGGPEEDLPASEFTVIFEGEPLDQRLFIEDDRPWDLPEFDEEERLRVLKGYLEMCFDSWKRDRIRSPNNRVDREWRRRLGKA